MLHNVQGVEMGGMDWLEQGDCVDINGDGGDADIDNGVDGPGMATAGLLVTGVVGVFRKLFLLRAFIFNLLFTRGSGVMAEERLFGYVGYPRGVLVMVVRLLLRIARRLAPAGDSAESSVPDS